MKTGMNAVEVIRELVEKNEVIRALNFFIYTPQKGVAEISEKPVFSRLLYHNSPDGKEVRLNWEEILNKNRIFTAIGGMEQGQALAVTSKVTAKKNQILQIPMMDFIDGDDPKEENLKNIRCFLEKKEYHGVILFSGKSFHFYGTNLMADREWKEFLGDCLLSGLADPRYVGHNLKDGYSTLRISACPPLRPVFPKAVALV